MYYRQPRYFGNFKCIGNECSENCCYGWRIDWTKEEVEKLKNAEDISPELKELVETYFVASDTVANMYQVNFDERGKCPCLTEDGWCRVQRELGVEYMSKTCMVYPRHYILADETAYRYCNMSCREVMRALLNDEKSMDLINVPIKQSVYIDGVTQNTPEQLKEHPEFKYRGALLEFFYEVIADKKRSVEDSLILGALAAEKFTQYAEDGSYDLIPDAIPAFRKQFHNPEQLKKIAEIKPNYNIKLGILSEAYNMVIRNKTDLSLTDSTGRYNIDYYIKGEKRLENVYKDRPFYLRNIALNLLLEFVLPFKFTKKSILENYSAFAAAFALFKFNTIAMSELVQRVEKSSTITQTENGLQMNVGVALDTDGYVHTSCARISRDLCHNNKTAAKLLEFLQEKKMTSPAYLALLVK